MTTNRKKPRPAGNRMKGIQVIGLASGEKGGPPEHVQLGESGAFARLVPLRKIPVWKGRGVLPPLSWVIWDDGKGHEQLVLAIAESQASGQAKSPR